MENNSPRLDAPGVDHKFPKLSNDINGDVVIVGGGIAGCITAYFLLHATHKKVTLLEGNRIAHGASGHNGGQIDVYFEKGIKELIAQYGEEKTKDAYSAMLDAREKLEEVISTIKRQGQYVKYIGYNVYKAEHQIYDACEHLYRLEKLGLEINELFVKNNVSFRDKIPEKYIEQVNRISEEEGSKYLGTTRLDRSGFEATHYGTLNTAALCYSLIEYFLQHYSSRFEVYEDTQVANIIPYEDKVTIQTKNGRTVKAQDIILCTNAYHSYLINQLEDVQHINGVRGYMAGYFINDAKAPLTICYQPEGSGYLDEYYYQTARLFANKKGEEKVLVSLGGPDKNVKNIGNYPSVYKEDLDRYIQKFYNNYSQGTYYWRGDMGYTDTGLRKIGTRPDYKHLRYNVGCNGVGILGSVHGGRKIAQLMLGKSQKESVFDIY